MKNSEDILSKLTDVLEERKSAPADSSYVASLYSKGLDKILEKVSEEAQETVEAAHEEGEAGEQHLVYEVADLWFHTMVLLAHKGLSTEDVTKELAKRFGLSGIEEKANRTKKPE